MSSAMLDHDWDDLRFFLAIAREGSLSAAAAVLGVTHTTVSRRITAFEKRLGVRLFERLPTGYVATPAGEEMREAAGRVEQEVASLDRKVLGRDERLQGTIRVTMPDIVAVNFMPHLEAFGRAYPCITLELVAGTAITNLTRREADVALRVTAKPAEHLVGRRMANLAVTFYATQAYLDRHPNVTDFTKHRFVGWDEAVPEIAPLRWMRENIPRERIVMRVNTPVIMAEAIRAGVGVGQLVCRTGDAQPGFVRVTQPDPKLAVPLWLLTHRDLRNVVRIRSFLDFMSERIVAERPRLEAA